MSPILEASAIAKAFGAVQVVDGVDLKVDFGETVALVGPNGAGKTTLLNVLSGQLRATSGSIRLAGRDVTDRHPSHIDRKPLLRSFQNGGAFGKLSAVDNVALAAVARGTPRGQAQIEARAALERVGLRPVADWRADTLSGGQRKLIDFARLLITRPALALLDEPTAGVSPAIMQTMREILLEERKRGLATVIVSHDLPWVYDLCRRVVVLGDGRLLAEGTPAEVSANQTVQEAYLG
jgi:ABC-type branched-subunit amino acid transport system ATPase component